jgi:hypothetical protein
MERLYLKPALCKAIEEYCKLNNIEDINNFANRCATQGFSIVKYGLSPPDNINRENNGIKDLKKNEKTTRKKKEPVPKDEGKQVKPEESLGAEERKEDVQPIEKEKSGVTVRKIRIIKKK